MRLAGGGRAAETSSLGTRPEVLKSCEPTAISEFCELDIILSAETIFCSQDQSTFLRNAARQRESPL